MKSLWRNLRDTGGYGKEEATKFIKAAEPLISKVISSYLGYQYVNDPLIREKAKTILMNALKNYDESKGSLTQFIWINLQRLQRVLGRQQTVLSMSEANMLLAKQLDSAEKELTEKLGRAPNIDELADYLKISPGRIRKIQALRSVGYASSYERGVEDSSSGGWLPAIKQEKSSLTDKFLKLVYDTLGSDKEKSLVELVYGLNGKEKVPTITEAARRVGISPASASRIVSKVENMLKELEESWNKVGDIKDVDII